MDSIETLNTMLQQLELKQGITFASQCVTTFEPLWQHLADETNAGLFTVVATEKLDPLKTLSRDDLTGYLNQIRSLPELSNEDAAMPRESFLLKAGTLLCRALNVRILDGAPRSLCLLSDSCIHLAAELDRLGESDTTKPKTRAVRSAPEPGDLEQIEIERQLRVMSALTSQSPTTDDESQESDERDLIADMAVRILAFEEG